MRPANALPALVLSISACGVLAACGSSSPTTSPSTTPSTSPLASTTPSATTSPTPAGAQDLAVTDAIRAQLVAAGAKAKGLKASDFVGLEKGLTYYAYDPATQTHWAGAALKPSTASMAAQVSVQDDGSYTLFHRSASGPWVAIDSGSAGGPANAPCPHAPPASVLAVWGWPAHSCHPAGA